MAFADILLVVANVVYGTSYVATRIVLDDVPPATLALVRLVLGGLALLLLNARTGSRTRLDRVDRWRVAAMGLVGSAGALALAHWGLARSTATNAALLIVVEPLTLLVLGPLLLGERLSVREQAGAACGLAGALLVVVNGIPGFSVRLVPHWRGDLLLVLSGLAYAAYSLLGRPVLARHPALSVTTGSILWGIPAAAPLAALEWLDGHRPVVTGGAVLGTFYLAVVITALGYLLWNYALERVTAGRAAVFINVQPVVGALLGVAWLGETVTVFTAAGGLLVVTGLLLTARSAERPAVYS